MLVSVDKQRAVLCLSQPIDYMNRGGGEPPKTFVISRFSLDSSWVSVEHGAFANDMEETAPEITALIIVIIVIYDSLFRVYG